MGFNNKKCSQEPQGFTGPNCSNINASIDIILLDNYPDTSTEKILITNLNISYNLNDNNIKEEKGKLVKLDGQENVTNIQSTDLPITSPRITKYNSNKSSNSIISKTK